MTTLNETKQQYLQKALSHSIQNKYGVQLSDGRVTTISDSQSFYVEGCQAELIAKVDKKYLIGNKVKEEVPIEMVSAPEGFFTGKQVYTFTTPALNRDNLKVEVLEIPMIGKAKVKFNAGQNFAIKSEKITQPLFRSADGKYYAESELPENDDEFITQLATQDVKNERNARISDTDDYAKLTDITVQPLAREKRRQLTEDERQELTAYRQQLRDMPSQTGFPFVEFPEFPSVLAFELQLKLNARNQRMEEMNHA